MTADDFVSALAEASGMDKSKRPETRAWAEIQKRKKPAFQHPPDPVLELAAWYNLSKATFWQLKFLEFTEPEIDGVWHFAQKATDDYYVEGNHILKMYYKESFPGETGLKSVQFLEVLVLYARMIAEWSDRNQGVNDPLFVEYAARATAISPNAKSLDWFWESRRR